MGQNSDATHYVVMKHKEEVGGGGLEVEKMFYGEIVRKSG